MSAAKSGDDNRNPRERREDLTDADLKELDLAGGVEGGMKAGSAGGRGQRDAEADSARSADELRR
jgi:hypothetical protein